MSPNSTIEIMETLPPADIAWHIYSARAISPPTLQLFLQSPHEDVNRVILPCTSFNSYYGRMRFGWKRRIILPILWASIINHKRSDLISASVQASASLTVAKTWYRPTMMIKAARATALKLLPMNWFSKCSKVATHVNTDDVLTWWHS